MPTSSNTNDRLSVLENFGTDPGSLSADIYIPKDFPKNGPLVVVLHGSTQSPESYDLGSGWSTLADECGLALLFPGPRGNHQVLDSFINVQRRRFITAALNEMPDRAYGNLGGKIGLLELQVPGRADQGCRCRIILSGKPTAMHQMDRFRDDLPE